MYYDNNQLPALPFGVPHPKPHGVRGLSKHYHLSFDPKLGHDICAIHHIPCTYIECKSMLDKSWFSGILSQKKAS